MVDFVVGIKTLSILSALTGLFVMVGSFFIFAYENQFHEDIMTPEVKNQSESDSHQLQLEGLEIPVPNLNLPGDGGIIWNHNRRDTTENEDYFLESPERRVKRFVESATSEDDGLINPETTTYSPAAGPRIKLLTSAPARLPPGFSRSTFTSTSGPPPKIKSHDRSQFTFDDNNSRGNNNNGQILFPDSNLPSTTTSTASNIFHNTGNQVLATVKDKWNALTGLFVPPTTSMTPREVIMNFSKHNLKAGKTINNKNGPMLESLRIEWQKIQPTFFTVVGISAGCGVLLILVSSMILCASNAGCRKYSKLWVAGHCFICVIFICSIVVLYVVSKHFDSNMDERNGLRDTTPTTPSGKKYLWTHEDLLQDDESKHIDTPKELLVAEAKYTCLLFYIITGISTGLVFVFVILGLCLICCCDSNNNDNWRNGSRESDTLLRENFRASQPLRISYFGDTFKK